MIVTNSGQGGQLPSVEDRGCSLDGTSYAALPPDDAARTKGALVPPPLEQFEISLTKQHTPRPKLSSSFSM